MLATASAEQKRGLRLASRWPKLAEVDDGMGNPDAPRFRCKPELMRAGDAPASNKAHGAGDSMRRGIVARYCLDGGGVIFPWHSLMS